MSRHPSPTPSNPAAQPLSAPRQKQKPFAVGTAAGADDVIYQAKYKELKRKVKDIESDNDKLHIKVMNARVSIQRMKMERAVLYERLSIVPSFPNVQERAGLPQSHLAPGLPPPRPVSATHHRHDSRDRPSMEPDQPLKDYIRSSGDRVNTGTDGRLGPVVDTHTGPGVALSHTSAVHSPRRSSAGHDGGRHHLPQMGQLPPAQRYESSRAHSYSNSHASPPLHHPHASSSHSRTRSHSSSRSRSHRLPAQSYHGGSSHPTQYPESLIPAQQVLHSPASIERERSRRHDFSDASASHGDPHGHVHHQAPLAQMSPRSDIRSSSHIHPQQRVGHATFINSSRDDLQERHRDLDRDREWEREREQDRRDSGRGREIDTHSASRSRQLIDRTDYKVSSRSREEQAYYADGSLPTGYPHPSRSGSPGSDSASGSVVGAGEDPPRSDSRSQFYEHDHSRSSSYRLRPVTNEDIDFVHEDGRSYSRSDRASGGIGGGGNFALAEQSRPPMDGRKRSRNDMDVDSDNDAEGPHGDSLYSTGRLQEDRGSVKRYHRERHQHRSDDNHEDNRMTS